MALTVKYFPTSRMNSIAPSFVSHSALLTRRAGAVVLSKSRKRAELRADPFDVLLDLLDREQLSFDRLATGVADQPGAAADNGNGAVSGALHMREGEHDEQRSDMQARSRGIEPDIPVTCPCASASRTPSVRHIPILATSTRRTGPSIATILASPMLLTRRAALKGVAVTSIGALHRRRHVRHGQ
jgi:hypothetical protein